MYSCTQDIELSVRVRGRNVRITLHSFVLSIILSGFILDYEVKEEVLISSLAQAIHGVMVFFLFNLSLK